MHFSYQAVDNTTGTVHVWTSALPDPEGAGYPGPNSPTCILQTNNPLEDQIGGSSTSVTLTSDPSAVILAVTIPNLLPSHYYTATLGSRVSLWCDATPLNSGSVDTTRDIAIQTNSSGVSAVTLLGTEYVDVSRLPTELVSATMTISATTGGFTIYATRTPGVACSAKAKWWLTGLEDLGEIAT